MKRNKHNKFIFIALFVAALLALLVWYLSTHSIPVFQPGGEVARKEKNLIIFGLILAVIVVVPTFALSIWITLKYRESNHNEKTKYRPDFDHSRLFESIWWGVPIIIIGILSYVAWDSSHSLSPYKALASANKPLTVQVVNLDWKWLFIYPEQGVASVNLAAVPVNTPVEFQVTSDTIMNSFWVPALGGQIYAMPGMITQLHEMADRTGDFAGSPANIAGKGFSRMDFTIRSVNQSDFYKWVARAKQSNRPLNQQTYAALAKPSDSASVSYYSSVDKDLFMSISDKYMMPMDDMAGMDKQNTTDQSSDKKGQMGHGHMNMNMDMDMSAGAMQ